MELRQLRYFVSVAEEENFTRAAVACHVAQPSLSQQIIKLEHELGRQLFERLGRRVRLTDAGRFLYERATEILSNVDAAGDELREETADGRGRVAVGAMITAAPYFLPPLLKSFSRSFPRAELVVHEDLTARIIDKCVHGELDVGLLALPVDDDRLHVEPLLEDELLLAVHHKHKLAAKRRVSIEDVMSEPFILLDPIHCLGEQVVSFCRGSGREPKVACRSSQIMTVQQLVSLDLGVSLLPASAAAADKSKTRRYIPLSGPRPFRTIAMVWRKKRSQSPLVRAFINEVRRQLAK